jgi:hypothetical protein
MVEIGGGSCRAFITDGSDFKRASSIIMSIRIDEYPGIIFANCECNLCFFLSKALS